MNKQCPKCGAFVPDNSNYCYNCGCDLTRVHTDIPPQYNPGPQYNSRPYDCNNPFDSSGPQGKSRGIAALLAIFLGGFGVHYFYLGKVGAGVITILLTLLTCSVWSVVTFIQGIYMLCITNEQFENKYAATLSSFPLF